MISLVNVCVLSLAVVYTVCYYYYIRYWIKKEYVLSYWYKMNNSKKKKINIENRTCYYFDDIIKFKDFNLDNTLIDGKSYESILVCNISYKSWIAAKPLRSWVDNMYGFIRVYEGT